MVAVYFGMESQKYAELVANFDSEEVYLACLPALEKLAKKNGFDHVTESIEPESSLWESPNCPALGKPSNGRQFLIKTLIQWE